MTPGGGSEQFADLLRAGSAPDPARPFLTYYDDATGERAELSWTTTANWVAKTANLLRDGLAVQPGDRVALLLPAHWQTAALLLASAAVGAVATLRDPDTDRAAALSAATGAEVVLARADLLPAVVTDCSGEVVGLALAPMGGRIAELPAGALDYAVEVPAYGDVFSAAGPTEATAAALDVDGTLVSSAKVARTARAAAGRWSLGPTDRVLSTLGWNNWLGLHAGLLAPLAAGAGTVLCRGSSPDRLASRIQAERVSAVAGMAPPPGSGVRRLDG